MASKFDQMVAEAIAHHKAGRLDQAETAYRDALGIVPGHPAITHNLGVVAAARGKHRAAINHFDAAIAAEPQYAAAHYNRAAALQALGQSGPAIQGFERVCAIEPGHYDAHRALGFLWLAEGDRGRALDHFARTYELRRGEDRTGIASRSLTEATRSKLVHDAEQFRFLSERRRDRQRFEALARNYEETAPGAPEEAGPLADRQIDLLGEDYNTAINISDAPELAGLAVSERPDRDALMRQFKAQQAGAVWFDGSNSFMVRIAVPIARPVTSCTCRITSSRRSSRRIEPRGARPKPDASMTQVPPEYRFQIGRLVRCPR